MAQTTSSGVYNNKNRNYIIGGVMVAILVGALAYYNGYFGSSSTAIPPNADGSPSTTNTTTP